MTPAFAVWLTGLPASGKSTIARALTAKLHERGVDAAVLESDVLRRLLTPQATYAPDERAAFYAAMAGLGALLVTQGIPVLFDATANRSGYRDAARAAVARFVEVLVTCPIDVCVARDPKGLYRRARSGDAPELPGVRAAYEAPPHPDLIVSGTDDPHRAASAIVRLLDDRHYLTSA